MLWKTNSNRFINNWDLAYHITFCMENRKSSIFIVQHCIVDDDRATTVALREGTNKFVSVLWHCSFLWLVACSKVWSFVSTNWNWNMLIDGIYFKKANSCPIGRRRAVAAWEISWRSNSNVLYNDMLCFFKYWTVISILL